MGLWGSALAGSLDNESPAVRETAAKAVTAEMLPLGQSVVIDLVNGQIPISLQFLRWMANQGQLAADMLSDAEYQRWINYPGHDQDTPKVC